MDRGPCFVRVSLIVPAFNERGNAGPLLAEIEEALAAVGQAWEVVWVDDASTDGSREMLPALMQEHNARNWTGDAAQGGGRWRVLTLAQRGGQSAALWAGLQAARGDILVTLDGDGQNDPGDISRLLEQLAEADLVIGHRIERHDPLRKRLFARGANWLRNALLGSCIADSGCGLRAFRREVLAALLPFDGMHRFLPSLAELHGFRVRSIPVRHRARGYGRSNYGVLDRLVGPLVDCWVLWWLKRRRLRTLAWREWPDDEESST